MARYGRPAPKPPATAAEQSTSALQLPSAGRRWHKAAQAWRTGINGDDDPNPARSLAVTSDFNVAFWHTPAVLGDVSGRFSSVA